MARNDADKGQSAVEKAIKQIDEARSSFHDQFTEDVEKRYKCWRGIPERRSEAMQWTSKLHPPYLFQISETILASLIDDQTRFRVRPRPIMSNPQEVERMVNGARALELVTNYQLDMDGYTKKKRQFVLQNNIAGFTVGKIRWNFEAHEKATSRKIDSSDPYQEVLTDMEGPKILHDDPTFEVRDCRDWFWHEAAVDLQSSPWVADRVWMTFEALKQLEAHGVYQNVDELKESRDFRDDYTDREETLWNRRRTKDMIEVIEFWKKTEQGIEVCTIGNRTVELAAPHPCPYHHGKYPFVIASSMPDLFQIPGVSEIEILADLQENLWTIMNQRLDNLSLANNLVTVMRSDVDDPDMFEYAPGAVWLVDDVQQVQPLPVNVDVARVSLEAEALLKGDMQNVSGGLPFMGGADTQGVDQQTATGVSIITSLGQRRIAAKKQQFSWCDEEVVSQFISLTQQYMEGEKLVPLIGVDGAMAFESVFPDDVIGDYHVNIEPMSESLMRQEKRAEAQAKVQLFMALAPIAQAMGVPLNAKAFLEDWLRAFEIDDIERYFASQPAPGMAGGAPGSLGSPPGAPPPAAGNGGPSSTAGVTAPQAYDSSSPSSQVSLSPEQFMQRLGAMSGGPNNV